MTHVLFKSLLINLLSCKGPHRVGNVFVDLTNRALTKKPVTEIPTLLYPIKWVIQS